MLKSKAVFSNMRRLANRTMCLHPLRVRPDELLSQRARLCPSRESIAGKLKQAALGIFRCSGRLMALMLACGVWLYRAAISPLMGPCCRFTPSCSDYARQAVYRYGALRGSWVALMRILRCHPFHPGGYDPVS